jgi:hypothetical protein
MTVTIDGAPYDVADQKPQTLLAAVHKTPGAWAIFGAYTAGFDEKLADPTVDVAAKAYDHYYTLLRVEPLHEYPKDDNFYLPENPSPQPN